MTAIATVSTSFFSCAKEELDYGKLNFIGDPKPIAVKATLPKSASIDKVTVGIGTDGKVRWENTDSICVNGSFLHIESVTSDTFAVFTGTAGAMIGTNGYWATYPSTLSATYPSQNSLNVTLSAEQSYDISSPTSIPNYMAAYTTSASQDNLDLHFKNLCCIIRIPVQAQGTGATGDAAILSRIEVEDEVNSLSGTATVNWNSGDPTLNFSNGGHVLALDCGTTNVTTQKTFSIMLPAGTNRSFTVKFIDGRGFYMEKTISGATLVRSTIYTTDPVILQIDEPEYYFSVSETKKVIFSQGNLQWISTGSHAVAGGGTAPGTWRFSENQWDFVGNSTLGNVYANGAKCNNASISSSYTGWIDLFGWGTSGYNSKYPYMTSMTWSDYGNGNNDIAGTNYDWGVYNAISNGGNQPGQWRTLTNAEWSYLFVGRDRAQDKCALTCVNGVNGVILLPDDISGLPIGFRLNTSVAIPPTTIVPEDFTRNTFTIEQWRILESAGAVFAPAAGSRARFTSGTTVSCDGNYLTYWASDYDKVNAGQAKDLGFGGMGPNGTGLGIHPDSDNLRYIGHSVRLVKDYVGSGTAKNAKKMKIH